MYIFIYIVSAKLENSHVLMHATNPAYSIHSEIFIHFIFVSIIFILYFHPMKIPGTEGGGDIMSELCPYHAHLQQKCMST